jgi:glutamate dehydrogenase
VCYWLIEQYGNELDIVKAVDRLRDHMARIYARHATYLSRAASARHEKAEKHYIAMGVPGKLASRMSLLLLTRPALDMSDLAAERKRDVLDAARLYSTFNDALGLYWLHNQAEDLDVEGRWQAKARSNLRDEFYRLRRKLAFQLLSPRSKKEPAVLAASWLHKNAAEVNQFKHMIDEMKLRDEIDFATLTVAADELRDLISK